MREITRGCGATVRFLLEYSSVGYYITFQEHNGPEDGMTVYNRERVEEIVNVLKRGANPPKGFFSGNDIAMETTYKQLVADLVARKQSSKEDLDKQVQDLEAMFEAHKKGESPDTKPIKDYWERIAVAEVVMEDLRRRVRSHS